MRVLVTGGRDFTDQQLLFDILDQLHRDKTISCIIHGAAPGADTLAGEWANERGIQVSVYPANWKKHGKAAGPLRNQEMLHQAMPDVVVAFPGGKGTADVVSRAEQAKVTVIKVEATL